ncbi:hypothetical protein FO499_12880 [Bacillus anthracis]|uniref:helix-turn-helix domain-containing protein n=1 Tax=Bacillus TaxID=1386 RepID=UPI000AC5B2ED|nr:MULTISPECIES: helix-turn-helix domain-containing protein [Bacillus]HDR4562014.1 helix-turn-helix domain-containing protein [Bacillus luti]MCT1379967.1 helix-turn-helix domain-containing protein [Bacillus sp. p3-SID196]MCU5470261.1 helix-turn-helix domain-containing protein [Bacillus paranthracis]MDR4407402.1 hypothetical protein [Bacillus anthracis]MED1648383.1 helix-turn-helix domain-containing protein [Bacillus pacificus]
MGRMLNVDEALCILQNYFITDSRQMVVRWIREGKIVGERTENRKEGYRISEENLNEFIESMRPGLQTFVQNYNTIRDDIQTLQEQLQTFQSEEKSVPASSVIGIDISFIINHLMTQSNNITMINQQVQILNKRLEKQEEKMNELQKMLERQGANKESGITEKKKKPVLEKKEDVEGEREEYNIGKQISFTSKEIEEAMKRVLSSEEFEKMASFIPQVKELLMNSMEEWYLGEGKEQYKCPYTEKTYELTLPFLKCYLKNMPKELLYASI